MNKENKMRLEILVELKDDNDKVIEDASCVIRGKPTVVFDDFMVQQIMSMYNRLPQEENKND